MTLPDLLFNGPKDAATTIALAHGAGAPMDSPFMQYFAEELGSVGFRVARFEFPYMAERRVTGTKKPPNRGPVLIETWMAVADALGPADLIVGGKSMGGRIASMIADEAGVRGLVALGYPFHPPGRPEKLRTEHLENLNTPALFCQGTRDPFGTREEADGFTLSKSIRFHWLEDGDHGFKPRKASGRTEPQNWDSAIAAITEFANALS